jgi:hypothetical protein
MKICLSGKILVAGGVFLAFVLGAVFFYFRPPVVLVSDASFDALYGVRRTWEKRITLSLRFFRRVKPVPVAENTGSDMLVFAVEEAALTPYCVLFPYRYEEAAGRYAARFPQIPVALLGGRIREAPEPGEIFFVSTDIMTDFYRAGRCAAIFAQNGDGRILFFQENSMAAAERAAFIDGLREQGFEGEPLFINAGVDYSGVEKVLCVVMVGSAPSFLERNPDVPLILFSWIDPGLTGRGVKVIFDDSPWAMVPETLAMISRKEKAGSFPSGILFPGDRIPEKGLLEQIKNVIYVIYTKEKQ